MRPKPPTVTIFPSQEHPQELEHLYARLAAVDGMIEALEEYQRSLSQGTVNGRSRKGLRGRQFPSSFRIRPDSSASESAPG